MTMTTADILHQRLTDGLTPLHLELQDDSHLHAGHAEAAAHGGSHFTTLIVSAKFEGHSLVQRHRMVYAAVGDLMKGRVHALSMQTLTPDEWRAKGSSSA